VQGLPRHGATGVTPRGGAVEGAVHAPSDPRPPATSGAVAARRPVADGDGTRRPPVWRPTQRPTWPPAARRPLMGGLQACRRPSCRPRRARGRTILSWRESAPPKWAAQAADRSPGGAAAPLPPAHHTDVRQQRCGQPNTQGGSRTTTPAGRRRRNSAARRGVPSKREWTASGSVAKARQLRQ